MITYSEIYETLRKEKYNEQLQQLNKKFFEDVAEYLEDKKKAASKSDETFNEAIAKTKKQLENTVTIIKELITRRQKKIVNLALVTAKIGISKRDAESMLPHEHELFESIVKKLEESEKKVNELLNGQKQVQKDLKNTLIRFTQATAQFLDEDNNTLGPFREGDIANLPTEVAEILIKSGSATKIEQE